MALNRLLWYCLNQGTTLEENRVGIRLDPDPGERAIFFKIDCDDFKKYFEVGENEQLCDGLVFYRKRGEAPIFIFVELKSDDLGHAIRQIENTFRIVSRFVPSLRPKAVFKGLVVLKSGVHKSRHRKNDSGHKVERKTLIPIKQKGGQHGKNADLRHCDVLD